MKELNEISKLYSRDVLLSIANGTYCPLVSSFREKYLGKSLVEMFDSTIQDLEANYRNDLYFRHLFTQEFFMNNSARDVSFLLGEVRAGNSIADLVILNDSSSVYEIKSDVDSLQRLSDQVSDYLQVFDKVNIVLGEKHIKNLHNLNYRVGIYMVNKQNCLRELKPAISNKSNVKQDVIFRTLRKPEYLAIIKKHYGIIPSVPNTMIYTECRQLFNRMKPEEAHQMFVWQLKSRANNQKYLLKNFERIPKSLRYPVLNYNFSEKTTEQLINNCMYGEP